MKALVRAAVDHAVANGAKIVEAYPTDPEHFGDGAGEDNRRAMRAFVEGGQVPGILAYEGDEPVGWCSVSPRPSLSRLVAEGQFRNPQRPDVWSIICFYVLESHHGRGVMKALVRAAVDHAVANGAKIVEAYPTNPEHFGDGAGGSIPAFESAGFREAHRISPIQVTMRYYVEET